MDQAFCKPLDCAAGRVPVMKKNKNVPSVCNYGCENKPLVLAVDFYQLTSWPHQEIMLWVSVAGRLGHSEAAEARSALVMVCPYY